jgi:hypothetical protein
MVKGIKMTKAIWTIGRCKDLVFIEPPSDVDKRYDDILIRVSGNFTASSAVDAAREIVTTLNNDEPLRDLVAQLGLSGKILEWLLLGKAGESSKVMAATAVGITTDENSHPTDSYDFGRCVQLIECAPEIRDHFPEISALSKEWKVLIDNWDDLTETYCDEVDGDHSEWAPVTSKHMSLLLTLY